MQTRLSFVLVALVALAACNGQSSPEVVDTNPDPMAKQLANAAPVELPAAIKAEQVFRCKDNSLVKVTFFSGDKKVFVRSGATGPRIILRAAVSGDPFVAEGGWSLVGDTATIKLTKPGKMELTCRS
ncbi:hypothetical protein EAH84_14805 [Sphingomonas oligophenolica]|uniref:C-type lysozyme inhibitor domain-containing protein n=2 Tax=Sphingomonas oligophenolica TaxID=301154 RepID=A0A502C3G3_9SPHN|nr:hypothetical protein EAH84_14805 [Sphingomonas oligophenolica]